MLNWFEWYAICEVKRLELGSKTQKKNVRRQHKLFEHSMFVLKIGTRIWRRGEERKIQITPVVCLREKNTLLLPVLLQTTPTSMENERTPRWLASKV